MIPNFTVESENVILRGFFTPIHIECTPELFGVFVFVFSNVKYDLVLFCDSEGNTNKSRRGKRKTRTSISLKTLVGAILSLYVSYVQFLVGELTLTPQRIVIKRNPSIKCGRLIVIKARITLRNMK